VYTVEPSGPAAAVTVTVPPYVASSKVSEVTPLMAAPEITEVSANSASVSVLKVLSIVTVPVTA
jgi:hypothetical protein